MKKLFIVFLIFPNLLIGQVMRNEIKEVINKTIISKNDKLYCIGNLGIYELNEQGETINTIKHTVEDNEPTTTSFIETPDTSLLVLMYKNELLNIKKFDQDLNLLSDNNLPIEQNLSFRNIPISIATDSTYIFAALMQYGGLLLSEFKESGDTLWVKTFGDIDANFNGLVQTSTDEYILYGNDIIIRFNRLGEILRMHDFNEYKVEYTTHLLQNDGIILGGNYVNNGLNLILTKFNFLLDSLFSKIYFVNDHSGSAILGYNSDLESIEVLVNNDINGSKGFTFLQCEQNLDTLKSLFVDNKNINETDIDRYNHFVRFKEKLLFFVLKGNFSKYRTKIYSFLNLSIDFPYTNKIRTIVCGSDLIIKPYIYNFDTFNYTANWLPNEHTISSNGLELVVNPDTSTYFIIKAENLRNQTQDTIFVDVKDFHIDVATTTPIINCGDSSRVFCRMDFNELEHNYDAISYSMDNYDLEWYPNKNLRKESADLIYVKPDTSTYYFCYASYKSCQAFDSILINYSPPNYQIEFGIDKNLLTQPPFAFQFENNTIDKHLYNFSWDFGDSTILNSNNDFVFHEYQYNGRYDVSLTAINIDASNCSDSIIKTDYIYCTGGNDYPSTKTNNNFNNDITIYPNPFKDNLYIKSISPAYCKLVSISGNVLYNWELLSRDEIEVDVSKLPKGEYILEYVINGKQISYLLVKN